MRSHFDYKHLLLCFFQCSLQLELAIILLSSADKQNRLSLTSLSQSKIWINAIALRIQQMLKGIWQWLKRLFQRLFGTSPQASTNRRETQIKIEAPLPLADSDYEYLFRQLLEGVAHGWQQERVSRWFETLKGRTTEAEWVAWLRRFGERVLASPAPNNELATRLVQVGEMTQSLPSHKTIGEVAYDIGRQLLIRETSGAVWEYDGPDDAQATAPPPSEAIPTQETEQTNPEAVQTETITLDELMVRLQQDDNLRQLVAQQLGIETTDPLVIIEELMHQFDTAEQSATNEAQAWFEQGNQQVEAGDFEGAVASYNKALEINPDFHEALFNRDIALDNLR
ncbi:MAG: tetratricopeptide repeat protein [Microcoleus sp. SIO2G3]|nr:tetratricopeptide repeat protein [Microcoleus sp. SIO2G3]